MDMGRGRVEFHKYLVYFVLFFLSFFPSSVHFPVHWHYALLLCGVLRHFKSPVFWKEFSKGSKVHIVPPPVLCASKRCVTSHVV